MPNSQNTNLTQGQLEIGAIITDGLRELRGAERAVERAQDRLNNSTKSFNARMHEAGAQSRDFKLATASSDAVYNFYRSAVIESLPEADQAAINGKACEAKTALLRLSIEDQAKCYEVMVKAYDVFLTKTITKK